jgi:hypothetical protein
MIIINKDLPNLEIKAIIFLLGERCITRPNWRGLSQYKAVNCESGQDSFVSQFYFVLIID